MARNFQKAQELVARGAEPHQAGQFDKAEKFYKRALKAQSDNVDALHLLGLVSHQKGRNEYAAQLIGKAQNLSPHNPAINTNLAIVMNALSRWLEAEQAAIAAAKADPEHAEAYNNLGRALAGQKKFEEAEAAYDKAIEFAPNNAAAENNLGYLHMQQGHYDLAEAAFLRAIEIESTFLLAFSNLATTYMAMEWLDRAEEVCRAALKIEPNFVPAVQSLGVVLSRNKQFEAAEQAFLHVLDLAPNHNQAISNLASLYSTQGRFDEAEQLFKSAITLNPNSTHAHLNLGLCYAELGQMADALASLEKAVACDADNVDAYYALASSGQASLDQAALDHLTALIEGADNALTPEQKTKTLFTLAMQTDGARSFDWYAKGNKLRAESLAESGQVFDPARQRETFTGLKATFTREFFVDRAEWGNDSATPVFVIGMPRSGTTLVEQIIAAHDEAEGVGERSDIPDLIKGFIQATGGEEAFPASALLLDKNQIAEDATAYLTKLENLSEGATWVVDKLPFNYAHLWLIQLMFPRAKIIHCRRDAKDVGLSCFQQNFVQSHPWSCDLAHIGHYIKAYEDLMNHWQNTLALPILEVFYEELVADQAAGSRRIMEFLGLDWQDSVMEFHATESRVKTASKWQVREPVYTSSIGRWQAFAEQLAPLTEVLESKT
jgi:Flp pilus assembly protein TadD